MLKVSGKNINKCALKLIYPNTNVTLACDEKCYFKTKEGKENKEWYVNNYPKIMENCFCNK